MYFIPLTSQTTKKLETVGVLQAYTDEDPPRRLRVDAEVMYKRVFAFFCLYTVCVYWVSLQRCLASYIVVLLTPLVMLI